MNIIINYTKYGFVEFEIVIDSYYNKLRQLFMIFIFIVSINDIPI